MVDSVLAACEFVLKELGEPQNSFWLASQIMEMRLWRASEADVENAIKTDQAKHGVASRFKSVGKDKWTIR